MNKGIVLASLVLLCSGCQDTKREATEIIPEKEEAIKHLNNRIENDKRLQIYSRVGQLDMVAITPGSGVYANLIPEMKNMVDNYGINILPEALENKNYFRCFDTEENRVKLFKKAISSRHKIIWAVRGGFGSGFIIEDLSKLPVPPKKTLVGFSDITSLHLFVTQKWGWKAIHAPVLMHLCKSEFTNERFETLVKILEGRLKKYSIGPLYPINRAAVMQKNIKGRLTGGNLTSIESSIGTNWEIQSKGKILFIEDINMVPWWIYRSMIHLKEAGKLSGVRAIVFGRFSNGGSQADVAAFLKKFAEAIEVPVFVTNEFGHGNLNYPIVYNANGIIHKKKMTIAIDD
ncbi:putative carboxypeptidase [Alphaproteobacteria bacterium]|nr:putative carboxypeptidase [Alphaproteobacteria bacterium]